MTAVTLAHLSDLHFGWDVDHDQIDALEALLPELRPDAIVLSGDLTQRARHGEFYLAQTFARALAGTAPTMVIPGNHDVQWWASPFGLLGAGRKYVKYRRYFGESLVPRLELPGMVIASALTSHGVALGSMTGNLNDLAVKGHLPASEVARVRRYFDGFPPDLTRVVVVHHNILRGAISHRMGLARWRRAQLGLRDSGADLILCGHDHQEGSGQVDGTVVVSTAGSHTFRTRGGRPSAFNLVTVSEDSIDVQHLRWDHELRRFVASDLARYGRMRER